MKLILCGKGGCGKSTVSTLLTREFARRGKRVLVVDSDESNFGLHRLLGMELPKDFIGWFGGKDVFGNRDNSKPVFDRRWTLGDIPAEYLSTDGAVSLMAIGKIHEAGEGCACSMGTLARCFLENLELRENEVVITDTEAGIEHLGRGVDRFADVMLVIVDPSYESLKLAEKIDGMGAQFGRHVFFILNRVRSDQIPFLEKAIHRADGIVGRIETNEQILLGGMQGEPLTELPEEIRRIAISMLLLAFGFSAMAQQSIQLRSANRAECVKSDMTSLKASFSFSSIDAQDYQSERGTFSWLSLPNTVIGGNEGAPQIPVINELIAVPFGATPRIEITSYSTTDYRLEDFGIKTLVPRQPALRKDQKDVPFVYDEAAYQSTRGFRSEPMARVSVNGTMRGVQVGQMTIEPVSYDPVNNTIRVFNNIEVTVHFDGADTRATEDMLVKTYSPYFDVLYKQLFNGRAVRDVYEDHPDLWKSPVRMLVIANRMFENCIQDWVAWKTTKGIYVDVYYTDNIGTSADAIKSFIQTKYAENAPTFLMIMGDEDQVPPSITSASLTSEVSDLYYSSVDGDQFVEMFHSRFSAETTAQMTAMLNKSLEYEQYTMPDPSYLNNVLLIAGHDTSGWGVTVGRPTIWYATNYYYNAAHGFDNVYEYTTDDYTNCYAPLNSGVGFANYTAHGAKTAWADPEFSVDDVANMTNEHKYFFAIGNCCITGDWGYSTPCFGEALTRAENKGAFAYIGSCPNTVWLNDYYFGVGPTSRADGTMPTQEETGTGIYDAIWMDDVYNTVNSILYIGNLAGNAAQALGYEMHKDPLYYWQAYHVLGDGSVMPYRVQPTANQVNHMAILPIGMSTYEVSAVPGSYVAISKDGVLLGAGLVGNTGTAQIEITPVTSGGDVTICVTAPNRIPYITTVPAAALEGAYLAVDSYTPTETHVGDNTNLSITFKNVGTDASTGNTTVTLSSSDSNVTVISGIEVQTFGALAAEASTTVSGFQFKINSGVADGTNVTMHYVAENGNDVYEGNIVVKANEAVLAYQNMSWNGGFTPGETLTLTAKFKNTGHYEATNAVAKITTTSSYLTLNGQTVNVGTIAAGQEVTCQFSVTVAANCPETEVIPVTFTLTSDGDLSAQGNENLKNACNVVFNLSDSYGDGWNGANLIVSFDDGTESQSLTFSSGNSATYTLEIGNGTHVTLTWSSGSYDGECSFTVSYEGDALIFSQTSRPSAGVLYEFDCNCAAASQTFMVTVSSSNTEQGTVSGGGEFSFGQSCTVTATPADGYMFTGWTMNGEIVSTASTYTFTVSSDMNLVANFAEGILIGDGGDATNSYLPTYNYYNYSLTEQIYTSAELGDASLITSIAFYNGGTEKTRTLDLYMKNTTKSSFSGNTDWIAVSSSDKVFSGSVTFTADDWTVVTFSTPFVYDGTSNVVLVTDDNSGAYTNQPHMACRVFDAASQAIYAYSDGTNYSPSSPSSYTGTVLSVKNQLLITKEAISTEPVYITVSVSPAQAGTVSGGGEIAFGDLCTVSVTPNEGYFFTGWTENGAVVSSDLEYSFSATSDRDLVATFVQGIEIGAFTTNNSYIPSYNYYNYSLTQQIYTAEEIGSAGTINWIAFYNEGAEKTRTYDFYLKATEKTFFSSNDDWITVAASDKVFSGSVTMAVGTWTIINFTTPFEYDGTSNLVLVADDNTGGYTSSPHMTCSVFNTDEDQAIYIYNDNTDFDPMSPPASSTNNDVLSVKSHILLGISNVMTFTKDILGYGTSNGGYYLIATPIDGIAPADVEHMIADNENNFDLYAFNEAEDFEWINFKQEGNFTTLESGKGYLYANKDNVTLTFSGTPYSGNGEFTLHKTDGGDFPGWNLVGNPFTETAYINRDFYTMNEDGSEIIGATSNSIETMEAVFVIAEEDGEILTFTTTEPATHDKGLTLNLNRNNSLIDRAIVRFDESRQLPKFQINKNSTKVYIPKDGQDYAVVCSEDMGEIPVNFKAENNGIYTLSINNEEVNFAYLHLIDNKTGNDVDLIVNPSYSFEARTTDYASRFKLVFATGDNSNSDNFAFFSNGSFVINNEGNAMLQVIDVTGRILKSESIEGCANVNVNSAPGVYMFRLINGDNVRTQKIVVR